MNRSVLVVSESFGSEFSAVEVGEAVCRGLEQSGWPCQSLAIEEDRGPKPKQLERLLADAYYVLIAKETLDRDTKSDEASTDVATRARQAGVSCHALVVENQLDDFGLRLLDIQYVEVVKSGLRPTTARTVEGAAVALGQQTARDFGIVSTA